MEHKLVRMRELLKAIPELPPPLPKKRCVVYFRASRSPEGRIAEPEACGFELVGKSEATLALAFFGRNPAVKAHLPVDDIDAVWELADGRYAVRVLGRVVFGTTADGAATAEYLPD